MGYMNLEFCSEIKGENTDLGVTGMWYGISDQWNNRIDHLGKTRVRKMCKYILA